MSRKIKRRDSAGGSIASDVKRRSNESKPTVEFFSSGCTTGNLALSGKGRNGGWARGRIINLTGDGSTGKTLLCLETAFWLYKNRKSLSSPLFPDTKDAWVVYVNKEGVMDMPLADMYGEGFIKFVEWCYNRKTVESVGRYYIQCLKKAQKKKLFLCFIIDSWDALGTTDSRKKFEDAVKKDSDAAAAKIAGKALYASDWFSNLTDYMEDNRANSTLIVISQLRVNMNATRFQKKLKKSGGKAFDFYTHQVATLSNIEKLKATSQGRRIVWGIRCKIEIDRSKVSAPWNYAEFIVVINRGLDDVMSNMHFLYGLKGKEKIRWNGKKYDRMEFVRMIEETGQEDELAKKVERKWKKADNTVRKEYLHGRKSRF